METNIFTHIKIIIYEVKICKNDKATHFYHSPGNVNKMSISMDLYPLILESADLQQAVELNSTRNVKTSDVNFH
jgi:hypothetical protein